MRECENFIHNKYGYCYYAIEPNDKAMVFNLYIEPEYRRKGYTKKLIKMVIREIRETGYDKEISIEAEPYEDSISVEDIISFYERMGLKVIKNIDKS